MANIDKELRDIKNAVYGREVRGSIHDGIDKINKETEVATGKANEAHDVMESIMTEGFDNAALESNFEQKLDDKISNLQPEWTGFKEDVTTQLAETEQVIERLNDVKASKTDVNQQITEAKNESKEYADGLFNNLDGLQIKGGFDSLQELINAYPNGTEGLFVVGNYLYGWNGSEWKFVKELEVMPWADFMTEQDEEWVI